MTNGSGASPPDSVVPQIGEEALYLKSLQELIQLRNDFARSKYKSYFVDQGGHCEGMKMRTYDKKACTSLW